MVRYLSILFISLSLLTSSADANIFSSKSTAKKTKQTKTQKAVNDDDLDVEQPASEEAPEPGYGDEEDNPANPTDNARRRKVEDDADQPIGISGGLGFGSGTFSINLAVTFPINRYFAWDISGYYLKQTGKNFENTEYGPEVDFIMRIPNSSMFTPFVGVGPGFVWWERVKDQKTFDNASSLTTNAIVGLDLSLSRHFSIVLANKWTTYVFDPPKSFDDETKREERNQSHVSLGFRLSF